MIVKVIIPAVNEEIALPHVLKDLPMEEIDEVIVIDNGSEDKTFSLAEAHGVTALHEPQRGYGQACLKGISYLSQQVPKPDVVVFLDGDYSDYPEEILYILDPIRKGEADMVIGSRFRGKQDKDAMTFPQYVGNRLACYLLEHLYQAKFTDLGPFRAIRYPSLKSLNMQDRDFGWTIEMQIKAVKKKIPWVEVPVSYRKRIGKSKISGTVGGVLMAGYKILYTIFKYR
ncbi:MAG: glycosyltransferase family 2 protein [Cytophagales bacterium]|nr:glycosyltransferase family 2 protein [Cytophagales bacterium]